MKYFANYDKSRIWLSGYLKFNNSVGINAKMALATKQN